jgi:hypothetical protein
MTDPQPRRRFLRGATGILLASPFFARAAAPGPADDFDAFWRAIDEGYAFLERPAEWREARGRWRPKAVAARARPDLLAALEGAAAELQDDAIVLAAHNPGSPRPVPFASDVWAEWIGADAVITAVRAGSVADSAGLHPGMVVTAVGGLPVADAVAKLLRKSRQADPRARDWALRRLVAGPWAGILAVDIRAGKSPRRFELLRTDEPPAATPPLIARRIGEGRDLGYLRIKNNLSDPGLVFHFDAALLHLKETRGLLLDLRETGAGGAPAVAEALAARFVTTETPWLIRAPGRARDAARTAPARITPRGNFSYAGPVAILVDRWTAGEGESLAIGMEAAIRATLIGTPMAGLRGDPKEVKLPSSGIGLRFPAGRVFHLNGTPREAVRPAMPVDLAAPSGGPGDPILYQGLKFLESRVGSTPRS